MLSTHNLRLMTLLLLAATMLAACGEGGGTTTTQPTPTQPLEVQVTSTTPPENTPTSPVGDLPTQPSGGGISLPTAERIGGPEITINKTGTIGNLMITVNSMRRWEGDDFYKPDAGNEYIILNMSVENVGAEDQRFFGSDTYLRDSAGKSYRGTILPTNERPPNGTFAPGEKKTGEWPYEVAISATGLSLVVDPMGSDRIEIPFEE